VPKATEVPITSSVLGWAINQSGLSNAEVAKGVGVSVDVLESWIDDSARPGLTQFKKLASKLHRPQALFLLPKPPFTPALKVQFRSSRSDDGRDLNPGERRMVRRALRLQLILSWLADELDLETFELQKFQTSVDAIGAARAARERLGVSFEDQLRWPSPSKAFDSWRDATEALGVPVLLFSMGKESVQGFSLFDRRSPIVAVNTSRSEEARMFTLFHELGHLLTRTSSACAGEAIRSADPVERWCDEFAAEVLAPAELVVNQASRIAGAKSQIDSLEPAGTLARRLKVSLRATVLALIRAGIATWDLYSKIPPAADAKPKGGGGSGRSRLDVREDEVGRRTAGLFVTAVQRDVLSRSQALDYLDVPDVQFDRIAPATIPNYAP
jgi:Zn-dependent peptidase ImmA (M78 family)